MVSKKDMLPALTLFVRAIYYQLTIQINASL